MSSPLPASTEFPVHCEEHRRIWNGNAELWDDRIGDGNDFQTLLIEPATERLLAVEPGDAILDIACGAGRFARRIAALGARFSIPHPCFHSAEIQRFAELSEIEAGRHVTRTGVKVSSYLSSSARKTEGIIGQPERTAPYCKPGKAGRQVERHAGDPADSGGPDDTALTAELRYGAGFFWARSKREVSM
jgi:hypothetical protein